MKIRCLAIALCLTLVAVGHAAEFNKSGECLSPQGGVRLEVGTDAAGHLAWRVEAAGRTVIGVSQAGVRVDGKDLGEAATVGQPDRREMDEKFPWRGDFAELRNHCRVAEFPIRSAGGNSSLEVRVFDDGVAWRCRIPGTGRRHIAGESLTWNLPAGAVCHANPNPTQYESVYLRARVEELKARIAARKRQEKIRKPGIGLPMTIELPGGGFTLITEAEVMGWSTVTAEPTDGTLLKGIFPDDPDGWDVNGDIASPWRIVLVAPDLDGLVHAPVVPAVCEPPDPKLFPQGIRTEWIKPGRCLWQWWAFNAAGTHWSRQFWFVDRAAELKCEYYLVDEGWEHTRQEWFKAGDPERAWPRLKELCAYAKKKGVGIWVWSAWSRNDERQYVGLETHEKRVDFFQHCREAGAAGVKIDFMKNGGHDMLEFYQDCLRLGAENRIMVDFHAANKPAGEVRTWPNEMTREGIRGLEHNKRGELPASHYADLPFTRMLAGPADFTPTTFNPERLKGTTVGLQLASAVVLTSPFLCWADSPDLYLKSPAVDVIRDLPVAWDETRVLAPSKIGELAALARRKGDEWWVGVVNGGAKKTVDLPMEFLGAGEWVADIFADGAAASDFAVTRQVKLSSTSPYRAQLSAGGGATLRLRRPR